MPRSSATRKADHRMGKRYILRLLKDQPCVDCGVQYPPPVMEFDHVHGQKEVKVTRLVNGTYSLMRILAETAKCEVRCANCHRLRHWKETQHG